MKKLYLILPAFCSLMLIFTSPARAHWADDDFNSDLMNTTLWSEFDEDESDPNHVVDVFQDGSTLNFTVSENIDDSSCDGGYLSNWTISLDSDFSLSVDYHYTHTGEDEAAVFLGLGNYGTDGSFRDISIAAGNYVNETGTILTFGYELDGEIPAEVNDFYPYSALDDGTLKVSYDAAGGVFTFSAIEDGNEIWSWTDAGTNDFEGEGISSLYVGLGLWSDGAVLADGEAYLDNFTVTPEPIGCTLFALGGLSLAALRRRRSMR